ncbi:MAG: DEAD/DEAH box helicase, partial [Saprospiraceae bacterium]
AEVICWRGMETVIIVCNGQNRYATGSMIGIVAVAVKAIAATSLFWLDQHTIEHWAPIYFGAQFGMLLIAIIGFYPKQRLRWKPRAWIGRMRDAIGVCTAETLFYFPFNHANKSAAEAVTEISGRLAELEFPLLFLRHLVEIKWETPDGNGAFKKQLTFTKPQRFSKLGESNIQFTYLTDIQIVNKKEKSTPLLSISRTEAKTQLTYQLVFQLKNNAIVPAAPRTIFCYFPTRVPTNFKFFVHAPFLLTDSREGIKMGAAWNRKLVDLLAKLLTDSFLPLREQGLLNSSFYQTLPLSRDVIHNVSKPNESTRFFQPLERQLHQYLRTTVEAVFPTTVEENTTDEDVIYNVSTPPLLSLKNAYLAESQSLIQLLSPTQLTTLFNHKNANWLFPNVPFQSDLGAFAKQLLNEAAHLQQRTFAILDWEIILKKLTPEFVKKQPDEWLLALHHELYQSHRSLWNVAQKTPLIRLENDAIVSPFSKLGQPNAWLPTDLKTDYPTVKKIFAEDVTSRAFLEQLGITTPDLREEIERHILPKYTTTTAITPTADDLEKIIARYFQSTTEEAEQLLVRLRDLPLVQAISAADGSLVAARADEVYFAEGDLLEYFVDNPAVKWLQLDGIYDNLLVRFGKEKLSRFFTKLGTSSLPHFVKSIDSLNDEERRELMQIETPGASYAMWEEVEDYALFGLEHFLETGLTVERSLLLWRILDQLFANINPPTQGIYRYEYQATHEVNFPPQWLRLLQTKKWLLNVDNQFVKVSEIVRGQWSADYQISNQHPLIELLFAKAERDRLNSLTDAERQAMELGQRLLSEGLSNTDLQQFQQWKERRERKKTDKTERKKRKQKEVETDTDEFNPAFLSSEELLEKQEEIRRKLEAELNEQLDALMKIEQLKAVIQAAEVYSFQWYQALLELEYLLAFDQTDKDKSLSIYFSKVEREEATNKTILLKKPEKYIPQRIEDMGDITLKLQLADERRTLAVEVVSIKDFSLRAKLKSPEEIEGLDFKQIHGAVLEVQNTIFTLEELVKSFNALEFDPEDSLQQLLPKNIRFIFGPPGTGKTTHLAREEIMPAMLGERSLKMLVLTPTNKSADVLVRKILTLLPDPPAWLLRFGTSGDSVVENAGLLRDNSLDISALDHYCVITTATRFPYDGFNFGHPDFQLKNIDWDVILVDEASMISLAMMTFILHQRPLTEFIIAGDPFQIEPIVYAEEWKGQNVYTLVNLQSFNPEEQAKSLVPFTYPVINLTTQYRALRTLGYVFSHFAYEGKLDHFRESETQRPLQLDDIEVKDINIIRFPVQKLETLYRPQRLNGSHYHIYSALLTAELVRYLTEQIFKNHIQKEQKAAAWKIGVICPYKAQAMLVDKVIAAQHIFKPKVKISCGTIHSFQGDECDIIINLYNPPLNISKSPKMFLNRKNILNVAVSRAKDYLFLLIPDEQTERVENLYQI